MKFDEIQRLKDHIKELDARVNRRSVKEVHEQLCWAWGQTQTLRILLLSARADLEGCDQEYGGFGDLEGIVDNFVRADAACTALRRALDSTLILAEEWQAYEEDRQKKTDQARTAE